MARSFFSVVVVEDPETVAAWYAQRFDFQTVVDLGWYVHQKDAHGHELGWMKPGLEHQPGAWQARSGGQGFGLCFEVDEVALDWQSWGKAEPVVLDLVQESWGQTHFTVRDPAGNLVDVIQAEVSHA